MGDSPLIFSKLELIEVPAPGDVHRLTVFVSVNEDNVAFGVRDVTIDDNVMSCDVVHVSREMLMDHVVGPVDKLIHISSLAMIVDGIRMKHAPKNVVIVPIDATRISFDALLYFEFVGHSEQPRDVLFG